MGREAVEFDVLGPLRVRDGARAVRLDAHLQRVLLAVLLCRANRGVSTSVLQDALWGDHPPRSATKVLQVYVHRLRRALGDHDRITHDRSGYTLVVRPGELDAARFEQLAERAARERAAGALSAARDLLRDALALWRGMPLTDIGDVPAVRADIDRMHEQWLAAYEECVDAELALGKHGETVGEVAGLVNEYPLRERLRAQLMLALYRNGRRAEALRVYDTGRRLLADELGIDPGRELRQLHAAILRNAPDLDTAAVQAPASVTVPQQLPGDVNGFTGRHGPLKQLDEMLPGDGGAATTVVISTISGTPGVGKTALAVRWAHQSLDHFPDGQLYVNLRGYASMRPVRPIEALAQFLRALGVAPEKAPLDVDEAAALYRSLVARRRMLILLDNAASIDQVRPLLPGGSGCLVLVTSRDRLSGLVAREGARRLMLDVLSLDEALSLLARMLGPERAGAEPDAAARLCELCAYLPLALRIAITHLIDHPELDIGAYAGMLEAGNRIAHLEVDGDEESAVRAAFDLSYARLPEQARWMFGLLGLVPGPDVDVDTAAALAGTTAAQARELLDRLSSAHLIDGPAKGRYTFHDLLRIYAGERTPASERSVATQRLYDYYLRTASAAATVLYPQILRLPVPSAAPAAVFDDPAAAMTWLDAERSNLVAAILQGNRPEAWLLADTLRGYFFYRRYLADWLAVADAALLVAQRSDEAQPQAAALLSRGLMHTSQGNYEEAASDFAQARDLSRAAEWTEGEAAALGSLGNAYSELGRPGRAAEQYSQCLAIYQRIGKAGGEASGLLNLGGAYREIGRPHDALRHHNRALALYQEVGATGGEGRALMSAAADLLELGRLEEAIAHYRRALDLLRSVGDRDGEATALNSYAVALCLSGQPAEGLREAENVLSTAVEIGDRLTEAAALNTISKALRYLGRHEEAVRRQEDALALSRGITYGLGEVRALLGLAATRRILGERGVASEFASQALTAAETAGYRILAARALTVLARIHLDQGDRSEATRIAAEALVIHRETGHRLGEARTLVILGDAAADAGDTGDADGARPLWQQAAGLFRDIGSAEGRLVGPHAR